MMPKTKPLKNGKFRIFVDGSYDDKVNIGTVASPTKSENSSI